MSISAQVQPLKSGQIVRGTINKIFPNQHAQVKLGNQVVYAQLEVPLKVGESYYFQVDTTGENIYLKVIKASQGKANQDSIHHLIQHLNLGSEDMIIHFLQRLTSQHIPFSAHQIRQAVTLLSGAENKEVAQQILQRMISLDLPMTEDVFTALYTATTEGLSEQLSSLYHFLNSDHSNQTVLSKQINNQIESLLFQNLNTKAAMINQILYDVNNHDQRLFQILRDLGVIELTQYGTWHSTWKTFSQDYLSNPTRFIEQLPFQLDLDQVLHSLLSMKEEQQTLMGTANHLLQRWTNPLINNGLTTQEFIVFKNEVQQQLVPLLPANHNLAMIHTMQQNDSNITNLLSMLQTIADEQTYQKIDHVLLITQNEQLPDFGAKQLFLNQLKRVLLFTGLNDENNLINDQPHQLTASLKQMLLQYIEQSDTQTSERLQSFVHLLNGLQLQSIYETNHFVYASIAIPGEKLYLNHDIQLEFESKKTPDGKINPDFCRIIFILDLSHLRKTMIDMQIQNRIVSLTIFNDDQSIKDYCKVWQPLLKEGLENLNYQLSNITVKPFSNQEKTVSHTETKYTKHTISHEGIDYRI